MFEQIKQNVNLLYVTTETWLKLKHNKVSLMIAKIWDLSQPAPLVEGELSPSSSCEPYPVWLGFLSSFSASVPISLTTLSVHSLHLFPLIFPSHHLPPLHPYSFILIIIFKQFPETTLPFLISVCFQSSATMCVSSCLLWKAVHSAACVLC